MMTTLHSHEMSLAKVYPAVLQIQIEERPICQAGCFGYGKWKEMGRAPEGLINGSCKAGLHNWYESIAFVTKTKKIWIREPMKLTIK